MSQAVVEITQLKYLVTDRQLLNSLHRCLALITWQKDVATKRKKAEHTEVEYLKRIDLSWQNENIIEQENTVVISEELVDYLCLKNIWGILSKSVFFTLKDICQFLAIHATSENIPELTFQIS